MKKLSLMMLIGIISTIFPLSMAMAEGKATPEEVYEKILQANEVVQQLGDEGLAAFKDPKGEFVWKDSYVFVIDCAKMTIVAHPKAKRIGAELQNNKDKNPDPEKKIYHNRAQCKIAETPNGGWVSYYWPKLKEEVASRKISFVLKSQGTDYALVAGIYNDNVNVETLNAQLK